MDSKKVILSTTILSSLLFLLLINTLYHFWFYNRISNGIITRVEQELNTIMAPIQSMEEQKINARFLSDWIESPRVRQNLDAYLEDLAIRTGCDALDFASSQSEIVYQSAGTEVKMSPENPRDSWYYNFISSDKNEDYELFYDSLKGKLYIYYNQKVYSSPGNLIGVLGYLVPYEEVSQILKQYSHGRLQTAFLVNFRGETILHPDQSKIGELNIYDYFGLLQKGTEGYNLSTLQPGRARTVKKVDYLDSFLVLDFRGIWLIKTLLTLGIILLNIVLWLFLRISGKRQVSA